MKEVQIMDKCQLAEYILNEPITEIKPLPMGWDYEVIQVNRCWTPRSGFGWQWKKSFWIISSPCLKTAPSKFHR